MKEIFEQFQFIPKMFNTASIRVQEYGVWSAIWSVIVCISTQICNITVNVIGVSVLYAIVLFVVMIIDFVTGISSSRKEWKELHPGKRFKSESKKGLRWVIKYFTYIAGFAIINLLSNEVSLLNIEELETLLKVDIAAIITGIFILMRFFLMLYVLSWELKSIDENLERLGYNFQIFDFFDNLISSVSGILKNKTGVDLDKKDKEK
jgi:hypothetical protein